MNSTSTLTSSDNFKETLKQQADIVRIVGDYVKLKKAGGQNFSGLCPFHAEKTPSFSVHAKRQFYLCLVCGESGDAHAEGQLFQSGGGSRRSGSHGAARRACARCRVFSGMSAAARGRECPRVPQGTRS